jgi:hypothetical protein
LQRVNLSKRRDGKSSVTLKRHGSCVVKVLNPAAMSHADGSQRAQAWKEIIRMNGRTVQDVHFELRRLEPQIQGRVGRPLGWLVNAIDNKNVELWGP